MPQGGQILAGDALAGQQAGQEQVQAGGLVEQGAGRRSQDLGAFEPAEQGVMQRPPRPPGAQLIDRLFLWRLVFVGTLMVAIPFALYLHQLSSGASHAQASTLAVNSMVAIEIAYLFNSRQRHASAWQRDTLLGNPVAVGCVLLLIVLQLAFSYLPWMQQWFGTASPDTAHWLQAIASGIVAFVLIELEKALLRQR